MASKIIVRGRKGEVVRQVRFENEVPILPPLPFAMSRSRADYARCSPNRSRVAFSSSSIARISSSRTRERRDTSASFITSFVARVISA